MKLDKIELEFQNFLKDNLSSTGPCGLKECLLLDGCRQLYEATGAGVYRELFVHRMERIVGSDGSLSLGDSAHGALGRNLFWMAEHTGEEKYMAAIDKQIAHVKESSAELAGETKADGRWLYLTQPFYMEYETKRHNKAEYKDIVRLMDFGVADWLRQPGDGKKQAGWLLMALVDVLGCMSMEIYEHYRELEENFKNIIRQLAGGGTMAGYAILKACRQKNLNAERYGGIGKKLLDHTTGSLDFKDCEEAGVRMMAYAQLLAFDAASGFL